MGAKERKRHANDSRRSAVIGICCNLNPQLLVIPEPLYQLRNVQSNAWLVNTALSMSACPLTIDLTITSDVRCDEDADSCLDAILNHSRR